MAEARTAYERSAAIREALAVEYPHDVQVLRDAGIAKEKIGLLHLADDRPAEGLVALLDAPETYQRLYDVGEAYRALGRHDYPAARVHFGLAVKLMHDILARDPRSGQSSSDRD